MAFWLLKTEPDDYSFDDLIKDRRSTWEGVRNPQALKFLREMKKGDEAFVYHTGKEKRVVGISEVVKSCYPDPEQDDERFVIVDIKPRKRLKSPVTLADIKADDAFRDFHLVRNSRLSVMPVTASLWRKILRMGGG